jgi:hypothetical protein
MGKVVVDLVRDRQGGRAEEESRFKNHQEGEGYGGFRGGMNRPNNDGWREGQRGYQHGRLGMGDRDSWGTLIRLGEGVLQTLDLEIRVVNIRGGRMRGKTTGRWILGQKFVGTRILGEGEGVAHLIASTAIEMDIS